MRAGHYIAAVRSARGMAEHLPLLNRGQGDIGGDRLLKSLAGVVAGCQVGIREHALAGGVRDLAVLQLNGVAVHVPALAGEVKEQVARRRGSLAHRRDRAWGAAAAGGDAVVRHQAGVRHDQLDLA